MTIRTDRCWIRRRCMPVLQGRRRRRGCLGGVRSLPDDVICDVMSSDGCGGDWPRPITDRCTTADNRLPRTRVRSNGQRLWHVAANVPVWLGRLIEDRRHSHLMSMWMMMILMMNIGGEKVRVVVAVAGIQRLTVAAPRVRRHRCTIHFHHFSSSAICNICRRQKTLLLTSAESSFIIIQIARPTEKQTVWNRQKQHQQWDCLNSRTYANIKRRKNTDINYGLLRDRPKIYNRLANREQKNIIITTKILQTWLRLNFSKTFKFALWTKRKSITH